MRIHLAIIFSLVCGPAMAETPLVAASPLIAAAPPDQTTQLSLPSSAGTTPHTCPPDRWYPQSSLRANQSGTATLAFRIDKEGKPTNLIVKTSSGYPAIDRASIACASEWKYVPAELNGNPTEALWAASVDFTTGNFRSNRAKSQYLDPSLQFCPGYPNSNLPGPKPTVVLIAIAANGSVADSSIAQSSGDSSLDQFVLACTSTAAFKQDVASGQQTAGKLLLPIFWPRQSR